MSFISTNILSEGSISGSTFFSGGTNLNLLFATGNDILVNKISGGTFNSNTRVLTLTNNTGGTFTVSGITDTYQTGGTFNVSGNSLTLNNNSGGIFTVTGVTNTLSASATLNFPSTGSRMSSDLTITVNGAAIGDAVSLGTPAAPTTNSVFVAFVSAANTVTVRFNNYTNASLDPASGTFKVVVHK